MTLRPRVASSAECGAQSARRTITTSCPAGPRWRSCSSCATVARTQLPGPGLAGGEDTRQLRLQCVVSNNRVTFYIDTVVNIDILIIDIKIC